MAEKGFLPEREKCVYTNSYWWVINWIETYAWFMCTLYLMQSHRSIITMITRTDVFASLWAILDALSRPAVAIDPYPTWNITIIRTIIHIVMDETIRRAAKVTFATIRRAVTSLLCELGNQCQYSQSCGVTALRIWQRLAVFWVQVRKCYDACMLL